MLLMIPFVGSQYNLLRMSWYKNMKPFRKNLKFVIKKYLRDIHYTFPGVGSSNNDLMLGETSN